MTAVQKYLLAQDVATGSPLPFPPETRLDMLGFLTPDKATYPTPVQIVVTYRQAFVVGVQGNSTEIKRSADGTLFLPEVQIQAREGAKVSPGEIAFAINANDILVDPPCLLKEKLQARLQDGSLTEAEEIGVRTYLSEGLPRLIPGQFGHAWYDLVGFYLPDSAVFPGPVTMLASRTTPYTLNQRGEAYRPAPDRHGQTLAADIEAPAKGMTVQVGCRAYALAPGNVLYGTPQQLGKALVAQATPGVARAYRAEQRAQSALARAFFGSAVRLPGSSEQKRDGGNVRPCDKARPSRSRSAQRMRKPAPSVVALT